MLNGEGVATVTVKVAATKHYQAQNIAIKINVLKRQNITTAVKNGAKIAYSTTMKSLGAKVSSEGGKLTYKSLDTSIVSVDSKGNLNFKKAKKLGKVTIQITAAKIFFLCSGNQETDDHYGKRNSICQLCTAAGT